MHLFTNSFSLASHSMTSLGSLAMAEVIIPQKSANTRNQCSPSQKRLLNIYQYTTDHC